ncbi:RNA polymerase sigma factor [Siminovitchia sp. FSL H7-0308]|uniref:RNA polymerase sigma-70 factor (ECF subfamily) n=1 Tax=Siminovitchia thermophila TaxID=1245522 RepID=A0ABS2R413_9BACI|nr:RNA polymerase sigma factor [Siminovitchia thermophila]MBM7714385.1 RNA polymerase sigma-70 factor (ECF subfamily) [Siminovitchia thermophila]ONK25063.1 RNA polymerase subunit sigma-24 [Bacillus sp. VT-16-64]
MNDLENLYRRIQRKIFAFFFVKTGNPFIAEDLTQDVFYEALKGFHRFTGNSSINTWVFSIAKNRLKKFYRSKKYSKLLQEKLACEAGAMPLPLEDLFVLREDSRTLIKRISRLDEKSRDIVTYRIYGELSFKEIGDLTGESELYARVTFHRAKMKLKKEMRSVNE